MVSCKTLLYSHIVLIWIFTLKQATGLCRAGFTQYGSHCFGIDPYSIKNWIEAEAHCEGFGGHLTSIHSQDELDFLLNLIRLSNNASSVRLSDALWVGLLHPYPLTITGQARFAYRQGWKWADQSTYDDSDQWYDQLWAYNAPQQLQNSAVIGVSGEKLIGKQQDGESNHGICKVPATCPTAFQQFGTSCYLIDPNKQVTRRKYQTFCTSLGGYLTSITSGPELAFLDRLIRHTFPDTAVDETFWIGLQNPAPVQMSGQPTSLRRYGWKWSDGSPYNVSLDVVWDWNQPGVGEKYTYMKNFVWLGTQEVEEQMRGICKVNVAKVMPVIPTPTTTSMTEVRTTTTTTTTTTKAPTTSTPSSTTTTTTTPTTTTTKVTRITSPSKPTTTTTTETTLKTTPSPSKPPRVYIETKPPILLPPILRTRETTFFPITTSTVTYPTLKPTSAENYPPIRNTPSNNNSKQPDSDNNNTNTVLINNEDRDNKSLQASGSRKFSSYAPAFVAAPVFVLFIIIIIVLVRKGYICSGGSGQASGRRRRMNSEQQRDTTIQVDNLGYYLSYPGLSIVEKEYKSIPGTYPYPNHIGRWQPAKNTFRNYIPYDDNRVTLEQRDGNPNSDYINASFINGNSSSNKTYIAAQGPREKTIVDFWRMVWEQAVTVIIMLTSPAESGKGKCLVYWPVEEGESIKYGDIKVMLDRQHVYVDDTMRIFFIKKGSQSRRVTQFYFHAWPDSGAPTYPVTLINFRRKVKKHVISDSAPVLIHCSSGVGRTGTFIAIDYLLEQAASERIVDVYSCVTKLRQQRPWMVTTLREYKCVYHALHEGVTTGSTTITRDQFYNTFRLLTTNQQEAGGATSLQQQFKTIKNIEAEFKLLGKIDTMRSLMKGIGKSSKKYYRNPEIFLKLDGYNKPNAFILTSAPVVTKIDTFWNTVHEKKCKAIVMLCPRENIPFIQTYFPDEEEATFPSPPLIIECLSVREDGSQFPVIAKEMKIEARDKPRHKFCHISVKSDLAQLPVPSQAAILVYLRNMARRQCHDTKTNTRFPMLVHCLNGSDWSGVFYVLCYALEQLELDHEVDIFQAVRQVRHLYPHLLQREEQYLLLYEAVAYHIQRNQPDYYTC